MKHLDLKIRVFSFTGVGLAVAGFIFIFLSPELFDLTEYRTYKTQIMDATGITQKTSVKSNGVEVGRVTKVDLNRAYTELIYQVTADVRIPKGSKVRIVTKGLLGDNFVNIEWAKDRGQYFEENEVIPEADDSYDFSRIAELIGNVGKDLQGVFESFSNAYGGESGEREINAIVENIVNSTRRLRVSLEAAEKQSRTFVASLHDSVNAESKEEVDKLIANLDDSLMEFRTTARNIKLASAQVKRGDGFMGNLVGGSTDTLEELEETVSAFRKALKASSRMTLEVDTHLEGRRDKTSQGYLDLRLWPRPDRYFNFGITALEEEQRDERTTTGTDSDGEYTRKTTKRQPQARFNLQFAQRWYYFALRFGLFQSEVGFAGDVYLFRDRLRIVTEAFDWKFADNDVRRVAHLKSYASILFFNHVYLMGGIDDYTKFKAEGDATKFQDPNYFIGAGLTFNDKDLRALFGAATLGGAAGG